MSDDFKTRAFNFYVSQGYAPHQAAALAANAVAESGGRTRVEHDGGTGVGIFGFRDPKPGVGRKTDLMTFAKENNLDPYDEKTQLMFSQHELTGSEKAAGDRLRTAKDYRDAQVATIGYLRPHFYNSDPNKQTIPADRWNPGAGFVGEQPMMGPAIAAAGSADTVNPQTGLLAAQDPRTAGDADLGGYGSPTAQQPTGYDSLAEKKKKEDAASAASAAMSKMGQDMVAAGAPKRPQWENLQASIHQPKELAALPDFTGGFGQQLAQNRLKRRNPWEEM